MDSELSSLAQRIEHLESTLAKMDDKLTQLVDYQQDSQTSIALEKQNLDRLSKDFDNLNSKVDELIGNISNLMNKEVPVALYRLDRVEKDVIRIGGKSHLDYKDLSTLTESRNSELDKRLRNVELKGILASGGSAGSLVIIFELVKYLLGY